MNVGTAIRAGITTLVALAALPAGAVTARAARADPAAAAIRSDELIVRLSAPAAAAMPADAAPRRPGAPLRVVPVPGALGAVAARLGLAFTPEFPAAPMRRGRGLASRSAAVDAAEERLRRDWVIHLPPGLAPARALELLRGAPGIEAAEPVPLLPIQAVPDDSLWSKSYYFYQPSRRDVHAPEAWDITTGDSTQIIAIVDTGVLMSHPDLAGNLWTNAAEAAGRSGEDDDGNGYVDDVHGWDFVDLPDSSLAAAGEDWRDEDADPNDFVGHGTGVAGVAAAVTNNHIGVAGAAGGARLMPLRAGWSAAAQPGGLVDGSAAARAIVYAARNGATVINCSFSTLSELDVSDALDLAYRAGVVVVMAAGNNGSPHVMADRPEVISVAALDANDKLTLFSNTGAYVDLAAAGLFLSTTTLVHVAGADSAGRRLPAYSATASGTSFSAPLVCGAVALVQAQRRAQGQPPLDPVSMQLRLVESADTIAAQNPGILGYGSGRVDFLRALTDAPGSYAVPIEGFSSGAVAVARDAGGTPFAIAATSAGRLLRLDGARRRVAWDVALPAAASGSPAVADLGGGQGIGIFVATTSGQVCGFDADGRPLAGWPASASGSPGASPAIGDIDGDGSDEVVWGDADGHVCAWHADGRAVRGFPASVGARHAAVRIALADLDGDRVDEIVAAVAATAAAGGAARLTVLARDGAPLPGWPRDEGAGVSLPFAPTVAMLDRDPRPACLVIERSDAGSALHAWNPDGSSRWALDLWGAAAGSPAVADVDGDGLSDVLVHGAAGNVSIVSGSGALERTTVAAPGDTVALPGAEIVVGPGAGGARHLRLSAGGTLADIDPTTGLMLPSSRAGDGTPTIADLDGDGRLEIVVPSDSLALLYVYSTGVPANDDARQWPTARGDPARTGSAIAANEPIADCVPPRAVIDLGGTVPRPGTIELRWTAPLENRGGRAARYDVRDSTGVLDAGDFALATPLAGAPAPAPVGGAEHLTVTGLTPDRRYSFALESADSAGNRSALSNVLELPGAPPLAVGDLSAAAVGSTSVRLAWTAIADAFGGRTARYEVRASPRPLDAASFDSAQVRIVVSPPAAPGAGEGADVPGLASGTRYWIALRAVDSLGVQSPLSNVVSVVPGPFLGRGGVRIVAGRTPGGVPVPLFWQSGAASATPSRIRVFDATGRLCRTLGTAAASEGVARWDGASDTGARVPPGVYFARLETSAGHATTRFVLIR